MSECDECVTHTKVDEMLIAGICFKGEFKDSAPKFDILLEECKDLICGPAMAVYDYGVYTDGIEIEACFPVETPVESGVLPERMRPPGWRPFSCPPPGVCSCQSPRLY